MIDLIRCRGRGSRFAALTVAALTLFALALVATPASAADPASAENFNPDELPVADGSIDVAPMVLSDRPDGSTTSDATTHLTAVTHPSAVVVEWHFCDSFTNDEVETGGVDLDPNVDGDCFKVGEDPTGVIPSPGPAAAGEAYELDVDIPAAQEDLGSTTEVVAWVCDAGPRTDANCDAEVEENVAIDDSSTPANPPAQTSAGEITFPAHGSSVSNEGFFATATTSPDVTDVVMCLAAETQAAGIVTDPADEGDGTAGDGDPMVCANDDDGVSPINPVSEHGTFKEWGVDFNEAEVNDNTEYALVLFEGDTPDMGGAGLYAGDPDGQLDSHYIVSALSTPTEVLLALNNFGDDCDGDPADMVTSETVVAPFDQDISGCIFDQTGNNVTNNFHYAFQATPDSDAGATTTNQSGFNDSNGEQQDLNSNNFFEMEDGDPGDAGTNADVEFRLASPGTWTVTFCLDSNNDAESANPLQSSTPCSGESLSASVTKEAIEEIDHVHVKRQDQTDALCHTGSSTTTAPAGSVLTLRGCTLGLTDATGAEVPVSGVHVLWITNPLSRPDDPGQITTQTNTSDSAGHATAQVTSGPGAGDKTSTFRFCLDEFPATGGALQGNGICDVADATSGAGPGTQADYQVNWTAAGQGQACPSGFNRIRGNNENNLLIGTAGCDKIKARGGNDTSRGKASNDVLNGGKGRDKGNGGPGIDRCVKTERKRRCET